MSFFRLTSSRPIAAPADETKSEGLFARMFRLWIENHERVAQFRLLDQ